MTDEEFFRKTWTYVNGPFVGAVFPNEVGTWGAFISSSDTNYIFQEFSSQEEGQEFIFDVVDATLESTEIVLNLIELLS